MPVATESFRCRYDGDVVDVKAGISHIAWDHEIVQRWPERFEDAEPDRDRTRSDLIRGEIAGQRFAVAAGRWEALASAAQFARILKLRSRARTNGHAPAPAPPRRESEIRAGAALVVGIATSRAWLLTRTGLRPVLRI